MKTKHNFEKFYFRLQKQRLLNCCGLQGAEEEKGLPHRAREQSTKMTVPIV